MDYSISAIDLGEFEVISKEGSLVLTTGLSLFFRGSRDCEQEIAFHKLHNLVSEGLGFSGTTTCCLTICPLIQGIPMHREDLGPDECAFVQVLAHLVEDLDVWQQLGLQLGPTSRLYSHDESSVSFNYRIEHTDPELPGSVSTEVVAAELECVRCHLDFHAQTDGLPNEEQHDPGGRPSGRRVSEPATRDSQDPTTAVEIAMVSDHPELEMVVRAALRHALLGSRPRGIHISKGFAGKALTEVAPAVFDTNRLRGVAARIPFIHGAAGAISYFAANAKSPSLRKKMQALDVQVLDQTSSSSRAAVPSPLAEKRLRGLVYSDSKPVSPRSSQASGSNEMIPPSLESGSSFLGVFSEVGFGEEVLLPGEWPFPSQVSSFGAEGTDAGPSQEFSQPPGSVDNYTTGWAHRTGMDDLFQPHLRAGGAMTVMDAMGTMRMPQYAEIPRYFKEYHDRLSIKTKEVGGTGGSYYHSTQV